MSPDSKNVIFIQILCCKNYTVNFPIFEKFFLILV